MEISDIFITFLSLTLFGLLIAFSPMLLMSQLFIVIRSKRPLFYSTILLAGVMLPIVILALIDSLFIDKRTNIDLGFAKSSVIPLLDVILGVTLLIVSAKLFASIARDKDRKQKPKKNSSFNLDKDEYSAKYIFTFAFLRSAMSLTSIIGITASVNALKNLTNSLAVIALGLIWVLFIGFSPFVGIIVYSLKQPSKIKKLENRITPLINRDYRRALAWLVLVAGLLLIVKGLI